MPMLQSFRGSYDLSRRRGVEEPVSHFANTHSYEDVEAKFKRADKFKINMSNIQRRPTDAIP